MSMCRSVNKYKKNEYNSKNNIYMFTRISWVYCSYHIPQSEWSHRCCLYNKAFHETIAVRYLLWRCGIHSQHRNFINYQLSREIRLKSIETSKPNDAIKLVITNNRWCRTENRHLVNLQRLMRKLMFAFFSSQFTQIFELSKSPNYNFDPQIAIVQYCRQLEHFDWIMRWYQVNYHPGDKCYIILLYHTRCYHELYADKFAIRENVNILTAKWILIRKVMLAFR